MRLNLQSSTYLSVPNKKPGVCAGFFLLCQLLTLGAVAIGAAVARAKLRPDEVKTVAMGNVVQAGTKMNPARHARPR